VDAGNTETQLEPQRGIVAQGLGDLDQMSAGYVQGELIAEHHHALDRCVEPLFAEHVGQLVDDLVEITAVRPRAVAG